jgi:hypothetical protein
MEFEPEYAERYCAFVDILGFRQLVEGLSSNPSGFQALKKLLRKVHSPTAASGGVTVLVQSVSDAVAISSPLNASGLLEIVLALQALALDLLHEGYFVRGAIVRGPLYHDEHMVFGEALIRAYDFETEVARFPRIILTRAVYDDVIGFRASTSVKFPEALFRLASDGATYVNVLEPLSAHLKRRATYFYKQSEEDRLEYMRFLEIKDRVQQRFEISVDNPKHFKKVRWFARYWNAIVPTEDQAFPRISGPGLDR